MSGNKNPLIAWDSCVFLAWFKQEDDKPLGEIEKQLKRIADGKATLLVSAVCFAEVLDKARKSTAGTQFREFAKRSNVMIVNVDARIATSAARLTAR